MIRFVLYEPSRYAWHVQNSSIATLSPSFRESRFKFSDAFLLKQV